MDGQADEIYRNAFIIYNLIVLVAAIAITVYSWCEQRNIQIRFSRSEKSARKKENKLQELTAAHRHLTDKYIEQQQAQIELLNEKNALLLSIQQRDEAIQQQQQITDYLNHEFRNLSFSILVSLESLLENPISKETPNLVRKSYNTAALSANIAQQFLEYMRSERNEIEAKPDNFDLERTCLSVLDAFLGSARMQANTLLLYYEPGLEKYFYSDEGIIKDILINLVGNAVKFTENGLIVLHVSGRKTPFAYEISLRVMDTGKGIPEEVQESIFEPFFKLECSDAIQPASGIGLALCCKKAHLLSGRIGLHSNLGSGSVFTFKLPLHAVNPHDAQVLFGQNKRNAFRPIYASILIVEDYDDIRIGLEQMLTRFKCKTDAASSGEQAIRKLSTRRYDAVLMDFRLPDMTGAEVIRKFRAEELPDEHVPIIALTASSSTAERETLLSAGADEIYIKPVVKRGLYEALLRHMPEDKLGPAYDERALGNTVTPFPTESRENDYHQFSALQEQLSAQLDKLELALQNEDLDNIYINARHLQIVVQGLAESEEALHLSHELTSEAIVHNLNKCWDLYNLLRDEIKRGLKKTIEHLEQAG